MASAYTDAHNRAIPAIAVVVNEEIKNSSVIWVYYVGKFAGEGRCEEDAEWQGLGPPNDILGSQEATSCSVDIHKKKFDPEKPADANAGPVEGIHADTARYYKFPFPQKFKEELKKEPGDPVKRSTGHVQKLQKIRCVPCQEATKRLSNYKKRQCDGAYFTSHFHITAYAKAPRETALQCLPEQ